jgi:hypothetical protein
MSGCSSIRPENPEKLGFHRMDFGVICYWVFLFKLFVTIQL